MPVIKREMWDFPGGSVVRTIPSNVRGVGSTPGQGAKIPCASQPKKQRLKAETIL